MARKVTHKIEVTEPITLEDLRWIVSQCEGMADSSQVTVKEHSGDQRDWTAASITVHGAPEIKSR